MTQPRTGGARAAAATALVLALAGCTATSAPRAGAVGTGGAATTAVRAPTGVAVDGVELEVTAFHLLPAVPGDPEVERAAAELRVPVTAMAQLHLVLRVRNTTAAPRSVAEDRLLLGHGSRTVRAAAGSTLPSAPLPPGAEQDGAAGFWVALRAGQGDVVLRWTHGTRTAVVPIGGVRQGA